MIHLFFFCLFSLVFESFILGFIGASMFCPFIHAVFFSFPKICFDEIFSLSVFCGFDSAFRDGSRSSSRFDLYFLEHRRVFFFCSSGTFEFLIRPPSFFLNFSLPDGFFVKSQRSSLSEDAIWADL